MSARRRLVFLAGSRYSSLGGGIAQALDPEVWELHAVAERVTLDRMKGITPGRVISKVGELVKGRIARWTGNAAERDPALCDVPGVTLHEVARLGDADCTALVARLAPFASINTGGCGILRQEFLDVAGPVLNIHCGLPYTRGFNAIEWSAWYGLALRFCVHVIEAGVDTGPVLHSEVFEMPAAPSSARLRDAHGERWAPLFVDALHRLAADPGGAAVAQDLAIGKPHFALHRRLRAVLDARLARDEQPGSWTPAIDAADLAGARPDLLGPIL